MYINNVSVKNIRGFERLNFDLQRPDKSYAGWTVFVGENGSGKSTLLKAIALCLVRIDTIRVLESNLSDWIRNKNSNGFINLTIQPSDSDGFESLEPEPNNIKVGWKISSNQSLKYNISDGDIFIASKTVLSHYPQGWFSCGYGSFRRILGKPSELTGLERRFITLFSESASLADVDSWLRQLNYKKLEKKVEEAHQLEILIELLNDDLLPNSVKVADVTSEGMWLIDSQGIKLTWGDMSDGYRSVLALVVDIMRHLFEAFNHKTLVSTVNGRRVINASGVVLIDEIDAHLHPEWQLKIGFWLKERFPKIQFLVTTHSPIICQAADENGLFVLPSPDSDDEPRAISPEEYQKIVNSRSDVILRSSLFGLQNTRSARAIDNRKRIAELNAKKRAGAKLSVVEATELNQLLKSLENEDD